MRGPTYIPDQCDLGSRSGHFHWGDSVELMRSLPAASVDAVICSPPFEGDQDIADGDRTGTSFRSWFRPFLKEFRRILRPGGCVAFELGGLWLSDAPGKAVQHAAAIAEMAESDWRLIQDFYYYNPQLLRSEPDGAHRAADSITPIWVMAPTYEVYYDVDALDRPPHRDFVHGNLLDFDTSGQYDQEYERTLGGTPYVDRWPTAVPALFVELLTQAGEHVLDPFAGTGATCFAAERLGRRWTGIELNRSLEPHTQAMFGIARDPAR